MRTPRFGRSGIAGLIVLLLMLTGCGRGGQGTTSGPQSGTPQISDRGPGMRRQPLSALQMPVPRTFELTHVDPKHFAAALGNDPVRIFEFVRDQIAFEAYTGYLRGPRGTLLAMAGNSVDRASLLAAMLQAAGQQIRFVKGTLPEQQARDLVTSMWAQRPNRQATGTGDSSPRLKTAGETLTGAIKRDYAGVRQQLDKAQWTPTAAAIPQLESLIAESRAHYWVQWAKDGRWIDLDPTFPDAASGRAHASAEQTSDVLPDALAHKIRVRVRLEEYTAAAPSSREILAYTASAADLAGMDVLLVHTPEKWSGPAGSLQSAISAAAEDTGRIKPVLIIGRQIVAGEPFRQKLSLTGLKGVGPQLSGEGTRNAVPIATGEWLEVEFTTPGRAPETVGRQIFDLVGKAGRSASQTLSPDDVKTRSDRAADLMQAIYSLLFTSGGVDAGHLSSLPETAPPGEEAPVDVGILLRRMTMTFAAGLDLLTSRVGRAERGVALLYPESPRLFIGEISTGGSTTRISLDLRRDRVRAVSLGPHPQDAIAARILRGVAAGTLERVLLEFITVQARDGGWRGTLMSTSALIERAAAAGVPLILLPREADRLQQTTSGDALAWLRETTAAGDFAIAPSRSVEVDGAPRFAWWRVNPTSGETVGVTDEGLHQGVGEYKIVEQQNEDRTLVYATRQTRAGSVTEIRVFYYSQDPRFLAYIDDLLARGFTMVP